MSNLSSQQVILIVDDEPVNIKLLQALLKDDYRLLAATNGKKAIEIAQSEPQPDLILLDVMMPEIDGFMVIEKLKSEQKTSNIAVLFVTAKLNSEDENKGLSMGALDYIIKPINTTAVKMKVATHLNAIRQQKFIESLLTEQTLSNVKNIEKIDDDHEKSEQLIKQYLSTIHEERERLQLALWASGNELWDWNIITGDVQRNNEFETIKLPYNTGQNIFQLYSDYLHPKDLPRFEQALILILTGKSIYLDLEYRISTANDEWVWIRDQARVISKNDNGEPTRMVGTIKDISKRKKEQKYSLTLAKALKNTSDGVWIADSNLNIEVINEAYCNITGWKEFEVIGHPITLPVTENQGSEFIDEIKEALDINQRWTGEVWDQGKNRLYPQELRIDSVHNEEDDSISYVGVFTDITFRKRVQEDLKKLANYDQLTQLPNRTLFYEHLNNVIQENRNTNSKFALLFIDLDNFKPVNDSLGHDVGDELLIAVSNNLSTIMRNQDFVARHGGDEFIMIVDHVEQANVANVAQRIINSIGQINQLKGHDIKVTASIGIAMYPDNGDTVEALLRNSDCAMYESKSLGKSTYHFFTE